MPRVRFRHVHRLKPGVRHKRHQQIAESVGKSRIGGKPLLNRPKISLPFGRRLRQRRDLGTCQPVEAIVAAVGEELRPKRLNGGVGPAIEREPDGRFRAHRGLRVPVLHLPPHHQHVGLRRNERFELDLHARRPRAFDQQLRLFDQQTLTNGHARQVGRKMQGQLADRLGARIRTLDVAGRATLADLPHPFRVFRSPRGLDRPTVGPALPAFHFDAVGDLVDVRRLRIIAPVEPSVPHVALAEAPDDGVGRLIDADRKVAVAQQQTFLGRQNRPFDLDRMTAGDYRIGGRDRLQGKENRNENAGYSNHGCFSRGEC